ncbi:hypothetical protein [Ichthyenterobacterium magnum]|uniref:Uncharacterized protein n=1 Tax=Ichthyenterobacterium magnum TaxID=1230530 RepID=A0A420DLF7_9FLAO|nr:hypothetical protein [Ichthyenterobacterium magnum]RKE95017.1 hypothetical protein BXY80_2035 [Ichthyenterobacterium magnum]
MKNKKLNTINTTGFKTPEDYFKSFDETLFNKLNDSNHLDTIKNHGFNMPEDYFVSFDDKVLKALNTEKETKVVTLFPWEKIAYASAVAAALVLMFNTVFNTSEQLSFDTLEITTIEDYLSQEDYTSLELASLFTENELNSSNLTHTIISDDSLEDYLLENTSIEDLIIE